METGLVHYCLHIKKSYIAELVFFFYICSFLVNSTQFQPWKFYVVHSGVHPPVTTRQPVCASVHPRALLGVSSVPVPASQLSNRISQHAFIYICN